MDTHDEAPTRPIVIADIGGTHGGDPEVAKSLAVESARAGADFVKTQCYRADQYVGDGESAREQFDRLTLPDPDHIEVKDLVEEDTEAEFLTSVFSVERSRFAAEELDCRSIKIASSELTNDRLLEDVADRFDTVYLSTGLATLDEVEGAVGQLQSVEECHVLQCTSEYPCPPPRANLAVMESFEAAFPNCGVGYSDHTTGTLAATVAAAMGASVVEKHISLDRAGQTADHIGAATPGELRELVGRLEQVTQLRGDPEKAPTPRESEVRNAYRGRFESGDVSNE